VKHAGLAGATVALIGPAIAFECCVDNANGLGWAYYWPAAVAGSGRIKFSKVAEVQLAQAAELLFEPQRFDVERRPLQGYDKDLRA
jgi:hypothetical protein